MAEQPKKKAATVHPALKAVAGEEASFMLSINKSALY